MDRVRNRMLADVREGRGALVLAILALWLVLLRPVCAAAEDHDVLPLPSDACCVSIDDSPSLGTSILKIPDAKSTAIAAPRAAPHLALAISDPLAGVGPHGRPPFIRLSYYARSARILS
jgi:hypothetical protein